MTCGIIGGTGATGRAVARELTRCGESEILIGGRNAPDQVDVMDRASLDAFCKRCGVIVNCGGPVMLLQDRVAQAAFRARCHYIDPAGMELVKERRLGHAREIADEGLTFAVSAGWMPGITELLPVYARAQAQTQMDTIESVSVYFGDSGEWSDNAMRDGVFHLRKAGMPKPAYFRKGDRVAVKMPAASRKADLGDPIGVRNFSLIALPEMDEAGQQMRDCEFHPYSYLSGTGAAINAMMIMLLPFSEAPHVRRLRRIFRGNRLAVGGFAAAHVEGTRGGRKAILKSRITFSEGREYWMNGVALATVARMAAAGNGIKRGLGFLFELADPVAMMAGLEKAGVEIATSLTQRNAVGLSL